MKTSTIWTIIVMLLIGANTATLVLMWKHKRKAPPADTHMEAKDFLIKQLSLTAAQVLQFDSLRESHHHTLDSLNNDTHVLKDSLFGNLNKPAVNKKLIAALTKKIGDDAALMDSATFYHFSKLRRILSSAQQEKFDSIISNVLHMMAHNSPPPGPQGPGPMGPQGPPPGKPGPADGRGTPPGN